MKQQKGDKYIERRVIVQIFFAICTILLIAYAAHLQLIDDTYRERAKAATIDQQTLYPSRGLIYDRNGDLLVYNDPIYDLEVIYKNVDPDMDTTLFCDLLGIDKETFEKNLDKDWSSIRYAKNTPYIFLKKISADKYTVFAEHLDKFPGFIPKRRSVRGYDTKSGAHVFGYISEVDEQILKDSAEIYTRGDYVGTNGLEREYEQELRGSKGTRYVLKDKWGHVVASFDNGELDTSAVSGYKLTTTLDIALQEYGEQLFAGKTGGAVAIEPATGEILALISSPNFSPETFVVNNDRGKAFAMIAQDSLQPFFNRAISAKYPPGSTIKPLIGLIALQEGIVGVDEYITCNGGYSYKTNFWGCHAGGGRHNVVTAIQKSCNTFFYSSYRDLIDSKGFSNPKQGLNILNSYLNALSLGVKTGIDIPNESGGLIPTPEYYDNVYSFQQAEWRSTYIISNGIGQGEMQMTTLQLANIMAFIANRGFYYSPHLVRSMNQNHEAIPLKYRNKNELDINQSYFPPIIKGMQLAVENGTAGLARIPGIPVAGKTGTSENPHGKDHSVFVAFAPIDNPQIAIAVFVENAGWGSSYAAPMAGLMIEKYLNDSIMPSRKYIETRMLTSDLTAKISTQ